MPYTSRLEINVGHHGQPVLCMGRYNVGIGNRRRRGHARRQRIPLFFQDWLRGRCMHVYSDKDEKPVDPERDDEDSSDDEVNEVVRKLLTVKAVRFNIQDNSRAHHTNEYDLTEKDADKAPSLVVRRGQPFDIDIDFERKFDESKEDMKLVFATGKSPSIINGTKVEIILSKEDLPGKWGAAIKEKKGNTVKLKIFTPPTCYVGKWCFQVRAFSKSPKPDQTSVCKVYAHSQLIYMLFNPWCKDDQVYLHDDGLLDEYVLNDTGKIFVGVAKSIGVRPWNFAQFEDPVLDCVLSILDWKGFPASSRGDPIKVVRKLTALVNSSDDNGILTGNWSGNYEGGKKPTSWTGSQAIIEEYYKTKSPVKYGQCWVFSAVLTTCCRALGLPTRSVTNFASAHDTDVSISIDYHFDSEGNPLKEYNNDSVWNFHVWNDVWMARPDLKDQEYGGWQACDSTPQEQSDGQYRCGPCPLMAIKNGDINVPYDGHFIFAEVNADVVFWQISENDQKKKMGVRTQSVGQHLSTYKPKCRGETDTSDIFSPCTDKRWEDITSEYKHKEGWGAERAAVMMANMSGTRAGIYNQPVEASQDVSVKVLNNEQCNYGDDLVVEVEFENLSKEERTVSGTWSLRSFYSTGVYAYQVRSERLHVNLGSEQKETKKMQIKFEEYNPNTIEGCFFKTSIVCMVQETNQTAMDDDDFRLIKPDLHLKVPKEVKVGSPFKVIVSFNNPLPVTLTQCSLEIEGPGLLKPRTIKQSSVGAQQTFNYDMEMTASKPGTRTIIANFDSKEIVDINGSHEIEVKEN
ncbi:Hemocyte protein-glutamine gamma-glutamyltransferase [Mizuhopecten yessoensis]|uniref:Hemocyte protein-glutamine gamma-glutamyltransferase n=1 Tax=Mizuhopecten yessoensis TaxID=6573 RepID=A0A210QQ33_MIZYE|nr:Hemocyte protein-glutamine gamma-glutamyltransferase [Mizuhopecten yessoensis]